MTDRWFAPRPAVALAAVPVAALAVPAADPRVALATSTLAIGGAVHGLGRAIGWWTKAERAPAALAMAWGLAVVVILGAALTTIGAWTPEVRTAVLLGGGLLGVAWAGRPERRPGPRQAGAATIAPLLIAAALAAIAIVAAAGDRDGALVPTGGAQAALRAFSSRLGDPGAVHVVDGGWAFALAIALMLAALRGAAGSARVALVLVAAALPLDGHGLAGRWSVVAMVLAALMTRRLAAEQPGHRLPAVALVLIGTAIALAFPALAWWHGLASLVLGVAFAALIHALGDDEAAAAGLADSPGGAALVTTIGVVAIVLVLVGVRTRAGIPATSWSERVERRLEAAAAFGDLGPAR